MMFEDPTTTECKETDYIIDLNNYRKRTDDIDMDDIYVTSLISDFLIDKERAYSL